MSSQVTPKQTNGGLNYAKIRNQKQKQISCDSENQNQQRSDISPIKGNPNEQQSIFENQAMDRDNLNYITSLLQGQEPKKKREMSKHKRTKSQINNFQFQDPPSPKQQSLTPNHSGNFQRSFDMDNQPQKLFNDFFQKEEPNQPETKIYTLSDTDPTHTNTNSNSNSDFLSVIDAYISNFISQPDNSFLLTPKKPQQKQQQLQDRKYEKQMEKKFKEMQFNQKLLINEFKQFNKRDQEQKTIINMQQQEMKKLKKQIKNLQQKCENYKQKYQQEKMQSENCYMLLEKLVKKKQDQKQAYNFMGKSNKMPQFFDADDIEQGSFSEESMIQDKKTMDDVQEQHLYLAIQNMIIDQNRKGNFVGQVYKQQFDQDDSIDI